MTMGPVAVAAFDPTDSDQDIAVPFSVMLCIGPVFRVGHVPFAVGSIVGTAPLPRGEPLELPPASPPPDPLLLVEPPLDPLDPVDPEEPLDPLELDPEPEPPLELPPLDPPLPPELFPPPEAPFPP